MKLAAISDVHVKLPHDDADRLLTQFLTHPEVQSSDTVALLGDIFDLMCGPHKAYLEKFAHLFNLMDELASAGKKVLYFEGNHDIHLQSLFRLKWPDGKVTTSLEPEIFQAEGRSYYLSHGDEHEIDNLAYQKYKRLITNKPLTFVANHVMPYWLLNFLGERASKASRKKGARDYNEELIRQRFRDGVTATTKGQYDFILGGHSHVKDIFTINEHSIYVNNGYALKSKTFLLINDHQISFPSLA